MKVRLGIISKRRPEYLEQYVPQSEMRIDEVEVEIPPIPDGWIVSSVMILFPKKTVKV